MMSGHGSSLKRSQNIDSFTISFVIGAIWRIAVAISKYRRCIARTFQSRHTTHPQRPTCHSSLHHGNSWRATLSLSQKSKDPSATNLQPKKDRWTVSGVTFMAPPAISTLSLPFLRPPFRRIQTARSLPGHDNTLDVYCPAHHTSRSHCLPLTPHRTPHASHIALNGHTSIPLCACITDYKLTAPSN